MTNAYVAFVDGVFTRTYGEVELSKLAIEGGIPIGMLVCYLKERDWFRYIGPMEFWMDIPRQEIPPELQMQALLFT